MKKNRGFLLITSVFTVLFLGLVIGISLMRSEIQLRQMDLRRASLSAFYAAESGVESAIYQLRINPGWREGFPETPLMDNENRTIGFYNLFIRDGEPLMNRPTVWVLSIGTDGERRVRRFIRARLAVENPASFFTFTVGDLVLGSGANINGSIFGRDVRFEVNYALPENLRWINVDNNVFYTRNIINRNDPFVRINGTVEQRPPATFVTLDLNRYRELAKANGSYINGDFTYNGEINRQNLGTQNGLVFVEGNLYISGRVTEPIHFVSAKNIYITVDLTYVESEEISPQIGLSAFQDVIISQNAPDDIEIEAFIYANGGLFRAEGSYTSKAKLNFNGAITVRGKKGERTSVNLNVYRERHYHYDINLQRNLQIPFMSFLADLISWEELINAQQAEEFFQE